MEMEETGGSEKPLARLYLLVSGNGKRAVVLRRGPRTIWQMWLWDLETDRVTPGQWFKGMIDTERCDVSNDGQYVVLALRKNRYFNGEWQGDHHTVVSRPPYFTALAYFPSGSHHWQGGYFRELNQVAIFSDVEAEGTRITDGCPFKIHHDSTAVLPQSKEGFHEWKSEFVDNRGRRFEAREGRIVQIGFDGVEEWVLADLNNSEFKEVVAPDWALSWKRR